MMDQQEFVDLLKQGDREAADLLYRTYSEKMMQICLRYVSDRQVAQDLLHDGFIIIFTSIDSLRRPDKLESWMSMIMKNLALKYLNQCKAAPVVSLNAVEEKEGSADAFPTSDLPTYESLLSVIERLPAGYQAIRRCSSCLYWKDCRTKKSGRCWASRLIHPLHNYSEPKKCSES